MKKRTLKALKKSIAKWEKNAERKFTHEVRTGVSDCPLCTLFFMNSCKGCPVSEASGVTNCDNTPYNNVVNLKPLSSEPVRPALKDAIEREVAFLKSLLPEGETA